MRQDLTYEMVEVVPAVQATGLPISSATFQTRPNTTSPGGAVNLTDWVDVAGLVGIACSLAAQSPFRPDPSAVRRMEEKFGTLGERHLWLQGYFPAVLQQYTVVVDATRYEIMAVEHDSQHQSTRCAVRYYTQ